MVISVNFYGQSEAYRPYRSLESTVVKVSTLLFVLNIFKKSLEFEAVMKQETFHFIS